MDLKEKWQEPKTRMIVVGAVVASLALVVSFYIKPDMTSVKEEKKEIEHIYAPRDTGVVLEKQELQLVQDELKKISRQERQASTKNNAHDLDAVYSELDRLSAKYEKVESELHLYKTGQKKLERTAYNNNQLTPSRNMTVDKHGNPVSIASPSVDASVPANNKQQPQLAPKVSGIRSVDASSDMILLQNGKVKTLVEANTVLTEDEAKTKEEMKAWRDQKEKELSDAIAALDVQETDPTYSVHLPTTSLITGILLSGMEAPTSVGSKREPLPAAVRIKLDALLPNNYRVDLRDCQALVSAVGSLSDNRAYMRLESVVCIDENGLIAEASAKGYGTGADGKAGIPGQLVARNGKMLAGSMWAGFFSGLAEGLAPQRVVGVQVNDEGSGFNTPDMGSIGAAAGLSGASSALDRVADYYVKMLEEIWPTINVDAMQEVTFFLQAPLKLTFQEVN
ncbi:TraB/VirB10 family protein (plasmid) [Vibrio sp. SS-MA-C1-2]|uniref:TraB/VirB10 family protein n=1 Tax=Vibrio sp. SS-MA-C1-2 TaxID=2908646 RepID=UPI001F2647A3|nr:TraB/VirB10 family protein [Vibrio sp. SS-MA-C1-2]UJF20352.1 TraB/VirB10 family protein [Vibrio sp. SS-MA-C1-2]